MLFLPNEDRQEKNFCDAFGGQLDIFLVIHRPRQIIWIYLKILLPNM